MVGILPAENSKTKSGMGVRNLYKKVVVMMDQEI